MPVGGFEPQTNVNLAVVPAGGAVASTPTITELGLLSVPDGANFQLELVSVGCVMHTLPADAGGVTVDIEWCDDSASDAVADLLAGHDLTSGGSTVLVYNQIWRGSQILDPGDGVNAEFHTDGGLTTPGVGLAFIVEYRVLKHS